MSRKQLLLLLPVVVTLSTLTVHFNNQSAIAMSPEVARQQSGRETVQASSLQNSKIESWLPRGIAAFIIGGHIIYSRKKEPK
jgi:hypothetical protein